MKPGVDGEVFIANEAGENGGRFWLVDNQTFRRVRINDVILMCRRILFGDKALKVPKFQTVSNLLFSSESVKLLLGPFFFT